MPKHVTASLTLEERLAKVPIRTLCIALLFLPLSALADPAAQWCKLNGNSAFLSVLTLVLDEIFIGGVLASLVFLVLAIPAMFFRRWRAVAVVALLCGVATMTSPFTIGPKTMEYRMTAFQRLGERSMPLVSAVHRFYSENGRPPRVLEELIPNYIERIPPTGMSAYPAYSYVAGEEALRNFDGNPWVIYVGCSLGLLNFDRFLYFPRQNYPEWGYGGSLERLGEWAYVHE